MLPETGFLLFLTGIYIAFVSREAYLRIHDHFLSVREVYDHIGQYP